MSLNRRTFLSALPLAAAGCATADSPLSALPRHNDASCVFCRIISGEAESTIVYRDDAVVAFADRAPLERGHLLIAPLTHVRTIYDLPSPLAGRLFAAAAKVARSVREVFNPDGLSVFQNNEAAAGQAVPHVHIHLIPRTEGRPIFETVVGRSRPTRSELDSTFEPLTRILPERVRF